MLFMVKKAVLCVLSVLSGENRFSSRYVSRECGKGNGCPKWRVMLRHNRDRKTVATERNPPSGSKHPMQDRCPKWLFGRVMLCHNRDWKTVATERNPPSGSKHPMQYRCPK